MNWDQFLNTFINPDRAANALETLVTDQFPIAQAMHTLGYGLLALFVLLEIYRMWVGGTERELAVLAAKVAIVGYLIGPSSPLAGIVRTTYGYAAQAGYAIVQGSAGTQYDAITAALTQATTTAPGGTWWSLFDPVTLTKYIIGALMSGMLLLLFQLVLGAVLGLFAFSVLASRVFVLISLLLAPVAFTMFLWRPMASFAAKWVSTALHAFLLPLIGAISLVAALELGLVQPIQDWAACMQQSVGSVEAGALACVGSMAGNFILAIVGGLVAIFLMLSVDHVVSSFLGAVEVTTAGLLAARWGAAVGQEHCARRFTVDVSHGGPGCGHAVAEPHPAGARRAVVECRVLPATNTSRYQTGARPGCGGSGGSFSSLCSCG